MSAAAPPPPTARAAGGDPDGASRAPASEWLAGLALAVFAAVETVSRLARHRILDEESLGDLLINLTQTQTALLGSGYPPHFYYPPSYLVLQDALWSLGLPVATALWFGAVASAAVACPFLGLRVLGREDHPRRALLAALSVVAVIYYVQWDLRTANSNGIVLACVLGAILCDRAGRPGRAGALLAVACAMKLYGLLLLPYLLWRRRIPWLCWSVVWVGFAFVALPVLWFGPGSALELTRAWLATFGAVADPLALPDFYKPLSRTLLLLFAEGAADGGALPVAGVQALTTGLQALWVAAIGVFLVGRRGDASQSRGALEVAAVLMLPLPLSPTFQAHHAVVALVPALWGVTVAADSRESPVRRVAAVALLGAALVLVKLVGDWPARALAIQGALVLYLALMFALPTIYTSSPTARISSSALLLRTTPGRSR